MAFNINKAVREKIFAKIALMGGSGSGKTYSALRLATGMATALEPILGRPAKIGMLNAEQSRGLYYANEFKYDIADIEAPHHPERYVEAIDFFVKQGYDILIMDTTSKEWEGKGGCLELQQLAGGTYQAWAKVTPRHDKFITAIAESPIHIIATMRGKDQYAMETSDDGKVSVKKLGVGAKQREGFEFDFTSTFLVDQIDNHAVAQKDNTHIFEDLGRVILEEKHGEKIVEWANSGEGYTPKPYKNVPEPVDAVKALKDEIIAVCKTLGGSKNESLMSFLKVYTPSGNPNDIKDETKLAELRKGLVELEKQSQEEAK